MITCAEDMDDPVRNLVQYGETPHKWEERLGSDAQIRTSSVGRSGVIFRKGILAIEVSDGTKLAEHIEYIHNLGSDALKVQLRRTTGKLCHEYSSKSGRIIPTRVLVDDVWEESNKSQNTDVIDSDDQRGSAMWTDEMVTSSCDLLLGKLQDPSFLGDETRRIKAVAMLKRLITNHPVGERFVRENIESIITSSTSRLLRGGKSKAVLTFLHIINASKEKRCKELTSLSFTRKAVVMMLLEVRTAATLIQNAFRAYKKWNAPNTMGDLKRETEAFQKSRADKMSKREYDVLNPSQTFGSDQEMFDLKVSHINARLSALSERWRSLHSCEENATYVISVRGPVHVGAQYTTVILEIISYLASDATCLLSVENRLDFIGAHGCVIIPLLLSNGSGRFDADVLCIMSSLSNCTECFYPVLNCGWLNQCLKCMKYLRNQNTDLLSDVPAVKRNANDNILHTQMDEEKFDLGGSPSQKIMRADEMVAEKKDAALLEVSRLSYMHCVETVRNIANHAAALFRGEERNSVTLAEIRNYSQNQNEERSGDYNKMTSEINIESLRIIDAIDEQPNRNKSKKSPKDFSSNLNSDPLRDNYKSSSVKILNMLGCDDLIKEIVESMTEASDVTLLKVRYLGPWSYNLKPIYFLFSFSIANVNHVTKLSYLI